MAKRITIIQGHPDRDARHFGHALADAYVDGAVAAGHVVRRIEVAELDLPPVHSQQEWDAGEPSAAVRQCQDDIAWAEHLVIVYPLWLGTMPAVVKAFLEQVLRPGFAVAAEQSATGWRKLLTGRSARIVVTMGMPAPVYRWFFGAHSLKSLERNILGFVGIAPIRESLIGMIEAGGPDKHDKWLARMRALGSAAK